MRASFRLRLSTLLVTAATMAGLAGSLAACSGGSPSGPPTPPPPTSRFTPGVTPAPANSVSLQSVSVTGTTLTLNVVATGVNNLASLYFDLVFNPAVLQFQSATIGPFLGTSGGNASLTVPTDTAILEAANAAGRIPMSLNLLPATVGASGTGTIATLVLTVRTTGTTGVSFEAFGALTPFPSAPVAGLTFVGGTATIE